MESLNFWQGEKVRLRGIEPNDAETMFQWNLDSDAMKRVDSVVLPRSYEKVKNQIEESSKKGPDGDSYAFAIENKEGELVGEIRTFDCNRRVGTFKYGIFIARSFWGKGYGQEVVRLILKYYFKELGYQKVTVHLYSFNDRSINFHEKLGFQREGQLRRMNFTDGKYYDDIYLGMTREEFEENPCRSFPGDSVPT
jgi:RimJ/RimL family protein N-acetyltransferase